MGRMRKTARLGEDWHVDDDDDDDDDDDWF